MKKNLLFFLIFFSLLANLCAEAEAQAISGGGGGGAVTQSGTWINTGQAASISVTPTVTATTYANGYVLGGLQTLTGAGRSSGLATYLQNVTVTSKGGQTAPMYIMVFNANPSSSTFTDDAAISVNSNDVTKIAAVIPISTWYSGGTATAAFVPNLVANMTPGSSTTLYAVAVTMGTPTLASTSDLTFLYGFTQN